MLLANYVRPDRIDKTSVIEPTAEGYQPVREAQAVATQFTRIYGPTVWDWKEKGKQMNGHFGQTAPPHAGRRMAAGLYTDPSQVPRGMYQRRGPMHPQAAHGCAPCPPCAMPTPKRLVPSGPPARTGEQIFTRKGPMRITGAVSADTNDEVTSAIARAFARGQSVRIRDARGRVIVAHPGKKQKHTFFSSLINKARELADKALGRRTQTRKAIMRAPRRPFMTAPPPSPYGKQFVAPHAMAPMVPAHPGQLTPALRPTTRPPVRVVRAAPAPAFNRSAQAANAIIGKNVSARPPASVWLPPQAGARKEDLRPAIAAAGLAVKLTRGPQSVTRPAVANAMNAFRNTGRYY